ncbi:MAG: VOC family protein [Ilumatobacteraceae bacterium]
MTSPDWPRPVVYFSVSAVDPERQRAFYSAMFNWDIGDGPFMQVPAGIGSPEIGIGGHINRADSPGFSLYVQVRDVNASLARAVELGGATVHDPFQVPGGAMIAGITDPEGNSLVLVQQ